MEFCGNNSRYQKRIIQIFTLQFMLFAFALMGLPLLFESPEFECKSIIKQDVNGTLVENEQWDYCREYVACSMQTGDYRIYRESRKSIANEFNLVCEKKIYIGYCQTALFLGIIFGFFFFVNLAESRGRKRTLKMFILIGGVSLICAGMSHTYYALVGAFFLVGLAYKGFENVYYIYINEISYYQKFLDQSNEINIIAFGFAQIIFNCITLFLPSWRLQLIAIIGAPQLLSILFINRNFLETPQYFILKKQFIEARLILNDIAIRNKRPAFIHRLEEELPRSKQQQMLESSDGKKNKDFEKESENYGVLDLFRFKSLLGSTVLLALIWMYQSLIYFGIIYGLWQIGDELHQNYLLICSCEVLGCIMSVPLLKYHAQLTWTYSITILCLVITLCQITLEFIPIPDFCFFRATSCNSERFCVLLQMCSKFCVTLLGSQLKKSTEEAYPKVIRRQGWKCCIFFGTLGSLAMPLIEIQEKNYLENYFGIIVVFVAFLFERKERKKLMEPAKEKGEIEELNKQNQALLKISLKGNKQSSQKKYDETLDFELEQFA